jgi:hypothetical protein
LSARSPGSRPRAGAQVPGRSGRLGRRALAR